jgi:superfamily II DNA helicase RecQ
MMPWHPRTAVDIPSHAQIHTATLAAFSITLCIGQIKAGIFQMQKKSDVVLISGMGSGKTLTFWIPMLYEPQSITVLVTALNVLGKQMAATLLHAGITAVNLTAENATNKMFQVSNF